MAAPESGWFATLDVAARDALAAAGRARRYPVQSVLLAEGTTSRNVIVVRAGRVRITTMSADGHETTLAVVGPGEVLGEISALDGRPHSATATALDPVEALVIQSPEFLQVVQDNGRLGLSLLRTVISRLRAADRVRAEFGSRDVLQRLCSLLVELQRDHGERDGDGGVRIATALSQEELATWLSASREAVNRALAHLRTLGLVETGRRRLTVRDVPRLERMAGR